MSLQHMKILQGPCKFRLMESLFHVADDPIDYPREAVTFLVEYRGEKCRISIPSVESIGRVFGEYETYRVKGYGKMVPNADRANSLFEHLPVELVYSVRDRNGVAQASF